MRQITRLIEALGFALPVVLVTVLTGCAEPRYRSVGNDERDLVIRMPRN